MYKYRNNIFSRHQRSLLCGLYASVNRSPGKQAFIVEGCSYTYEKLYSDAHKLAQVLIDRGLCRGDRVAMYMDNTWPCIVSIYGIMLAGGIFVVINPQTKASKLYAVLQDSGATVLLTDYHLEYLYSQIANDLTNLRNILVVGDRLDEKKDNDSIKVESYNQLIEEVEVRDFSVNPIPNDLAALIYTSGTTGIPKGVMQTHQAMNFTVWSLIEYLRLSENDRIMLMLPLAFDYGLYQLLMTVALGATLIVERSFTYPAQTYHRLKEQKVSVFPGVPTVYAMLISSYKKEKLCFPDVKLVTNTAATLPSEYISYLQLIFPNALIYNMYGLTECKRVSYLEPDLLGKIPTSVGKAIPGTEVYLLSKNGEPVPPEKEGILYVRGPHVMAGYWNNPELSKKYLKPGPLPGEKVLCTHDRFRMDEDGNLYFVGRSDDIIKIRGEKVSPVEIETVLHNINGIIEAAIVGVDDDLLGQYVRAYVVLELDAELNEKKIKRYCLDKLENFMVPKQVVVLEELPRTANGKIDKIQLLELTI